MSNATFNFNRNSKCTKIRQTQVDWLVQQDDDFLREHKVIVVMPDGSVYNRLNGETEDFIVILQSKKGLVTPNKGRYYYWATGTGKLMINNDSPEIAAFLAS